MGEGEIDFVFGFAVEFEEDSFLFEVEDVIIELLVNEYWLLICILITLPNIRRWLVNSTSSVGRIEI